MCKLVWRLVIPGFFIALISLLSLLLIPETLRLSVFGRIIEPKANSAFFLCFSIATGIASIPMEFFKSSRGETYLFSSPLGRWKLLIELYSPGFLVTLTVAFLSHVIMQPRIGPIYFTVFQGCLVFVLLYTIQFCLGLFDHQQTISSLAIVMVLISIVFVSIAVYHHLLKYGIAAPLPIAIFISLSLNMLFSFPAFIYRFLILDDRGWRYRSKVHAGGVLGSVLLLTLTSVASIVFMIFRL